MHVILFGTSTAASNTERRVKTQPFSRLELLRDGVGWSATTQKTLATAAKGLFLGTFLGTHLIGKG
jgi:hypothetical protein